MDGSKKLKTLGMDGRLAGTEIPEKAFCVEAAIETTNKIFTKKGDEFNVFKEMPENIKEKDGRLAGTEIPEKAFCVEAAIETTNKIFTKKGDEFNVFKEMPENIKEKTGILAEYTKVRYDSNFFRVVEMYPTLY